MDFQTAAENQWAAAEAAYYRKLDIAQEEADEREEQERQAKRLAAWHIRHSLPEILAAWVEADDLCEEDYAKSDQSDFEAFNADTLEMMGEQPLRLPLPMPTYPQYTALKAAPLMRGSDPRIRTRKAA
jgi:hypothetical protein